MVIKILCPFQVSKSDHSSVRELVWDLVYSKNITNEIEKCRYCEDFIVLFCSVRCLSSPRVFC